MIKGTPVRVCLETCAARNVKLKHARKERQEVGTGGEAGPGCGRLGLARRWKWSILPLKGRTRGGSTAPPGLNQAEKPRFFRKAPDRYDNARRSNGKCVNRAGKAERGRRRSPGRSRAGVPRKGDQAWLATSIWCSRALVMRAMRAASPRASTLRRRRGSVLEGRRLKRQSLKLRERPSRRLSSRACGA